MPRRRIELMPEEPWEDDEMPRNDGKHRLVLTPDPDNPESGQGTFVVDEGPRKIGTPHPHTGKGHKFGGATPRTHIWWRKPGE